MVVLVADDVLVPVLLVCSKDPIDRVVIVYWKEERMPCEH